MPICKLCLTENKTLCKSHLIPSFAVRWLKKTSATGYIRKKTNPNIRLQDGPKKRLLCKKCEAIFNEHETSFSKKIFHPYVDTQLNKDGIATGNIKFFEYDKWLLRFLISIQWRVIVDSYSELQTFPERFSSDRDRAERVWRNFLLNRTSHTYVGENHIIFLSSLAGGRGFLPAGTSKRLNFYLLRTFDGTIVIGRNIFAVYSKVGPISFFTTLKPRKLERTTDTKVKMRGKIKTGQQLRNDIINNYIFYIRPNETFDGSKMSIKQWDKVDKDMKGNIKRTSNSLTMKAYEADLLIKNFIKK